MGVTLTSRIPAIIAQAERAAYQAVEKTAADIEAGAKERSRVDTGQMKNGWRTEQLGEKKREVGNPVEHSIYNELGTEDMAPQPMLTPSIEEARPGFYEAMRQAYQ